MAEQEKIVELMQRNLSKIFVTLGVSSAAVGVYMFLRRFGIIYQLFHKVNLFYINKVHLHIVHGPSPKFEHACRYSTGILENIDYLHCLIVPDKVFIFEINFTAQNRCIGCTLPNL